MEKAPEIHPLFSLIIPVYNSEKYIRRCLDSVIGQNNKNYEVVIVDDGSEDCSVDICLNYVNKYNNIKIYKIKHSGPCAARNYGIRKSRGKYISYLDSDDWINKDYFNVLEDIINRCEYPSMIIFNFTYYRSKTNLQISGLEYYIGNKITPGYYDKCKLKLEIYPYFFYLYNFNFPNCRALFSKELLMNHYCKDESIVLGDDDAYVYECVYFAESIYFLDETLYFYWQNNKNSITKKTKHTIFTKMKIYNYIFNHLLNRSTLVDKQLIYTYYNELWGYLFDMCCSKRLKQILKVFKTNNDKDIVETSKMVIKNKLGYKSETVLSFLLSKKMYLLVIIYVRLIKKFKTFRWGA